MQLDSVQEHSVNVRWGMNCFATASHHRHVLTCSIPGPCVTQLFKCCSCSKSLQYSYKHHGQPQSILRVASCLGNHIVFILPADKRQKKINLVGLLENTCWLHVYWIAPTVGDTLKAVAKSSHKRLPYGDQTGCDFKELPWQLYKAITRGLTNTKGGQVMEVIWFAFCCYDKVLWSKALCGRRKFVLAYSSLVTSIIKGCQLRTEAEATEEYCLLTHSLAHTWLVFLYSPDPPA